MSEVEAEMQDGRGLTLRGVRKLKAMLEERLAGKVDVVQGKVLSSNDWTYADSLKLQRMQTDLGVGDSPTFENLTVNGYIDGGLFL